MKALKYISITSLFLVLAFLCVCAYFCIRYPKKYSYEIERYALEYNLNSNLVYAIVNAESSFNPNAVSSSGAIGLMQVMPSTAKWIAGELNEIYQIEKLYTPQTNIKYGCFYLRYLMNKFNNETYSLCAYNAGETVVRNWINSQTEFTILYPETQNYVKKVQSAKQVYKVLNKLSIKA